MIMVLVIVGTVVGLSINFIEPIMRKGPALKEAVLILPYLAFTRESSNVPMVITSTGESQVVSTLPVSIGLARKSVTGLSLIRVILKT